MRVQDGYVVPDDLPPPDADGRRAAQETSRQCRYCGGDGLAIVDARSPRSRVRSCAAFCTCVHGRWLRAWHETKGSRSVTDRIPDLAIVLRGQDPMWEYLSHDPPENNPSEAPTRSQINTMFRRPT